jgi:predicted  nucleic acid-binding Zn-ribbon protein
MVGRSKIVEISRNVPLVEAQPSAIEGDEDMITAANRDVDLEQEYLAEPDPVEYSYDHNDNVDAYEEAETSTSHSWKAITIIGFLCTLFIGWTGFWAWANQAELVAMQSPSRIAELIALWAVPSALLALCWLLAMRLSSTEARRFGDVAALLRTESEALETRIKTVNGEIALARSFLAENARELESVGRASAQKLTEAAEQLATALADSDQKAQTLQTVSSAAVNNVELLRNHLPVVTSAAKDTTNQIGNAGNIANEQIQSLTAALVSMNEAMAVSGQTVTNLEAQTGLASSKISNAADEVVAKLEAATEASEARTGALFATLQSEISTIEQRLGESAENIEALSETNAKRLIEQVEQLRRAVADVDQSTGNQERQLSAIVTRLNNATDDAKTKLDAINADASMQIDGFVERIDASLEDCSAKLSVIDESATDRIAKLAFALTALSESSSELTVNLAGSEERAASVLGDAEKLMLALDNVSRELDDNIPSSLLQLQSRLTEGQDAIKALRDEASQLESQSASLNGMFAQVGAVLKKQREEVGALLTDSDASLDNKREKAESLSASLAHTHSLITDVSAAAEQHLAGSLQRVAEAAHEAAQSSKAIVESELADITDRLNEQNKALLAGAINAQLAGLGSAVNDAIAHNLTLSEEATQRVSKQLQSVSELTYSLEQRAAAARDKFDGIDDEAFARRIALLTESLNSAAIDVAKILSNEVTDTAWAAYLKGDRGVFTRRAVRLLDSGETRIIANHYDNDLEFRDHVNRYIHDFESMMRVLLSTRDGNAIGVTLLSSDVGKLYVALAQAIERLRS